MNLRTVGLLSGVLGGLCWLLRLALHASGSGSDETLDLLFLGGAVLVSIALIGFGTGLVSRSAVWLRAIVGVAFPLLVWSLLSLVRVSQPELVDGLVGALVASASATLLFRRRPPQERPARRRSSGGAHAR